MIKFNKKATIPGSYKMATPLSIKIADCLFFPASASNFYHSDWLEMLYLKGKAPHDRSSPGGENYF